MPRPLALSLLFLALAACKQSPLPAVDLDLSAEIDRIRAFDDHAHPVRITQSGESPDRLFDALPVDNMESQSDPVNLRADAPWIGDAWQALYGVGHPDQQRKQATMQEKGSAYPTWVLDQIGVETMVANRVLMGSSIEPPRFVWAPYADALIFPLDNSQLASVNSDRKSFFALEDSLRGRYLQDAALSAIPATLAEYLTRVVTPTLEKQRQGGAIAEKFEAAYLRSLAFDKVDRATAERIYANKGSAAKTADYKQLQDFLFRYIAAECGRLGMAVHIHTEAGAGSYFDVSGANPLNLESVLNDPELRKTKFVMLHGGWPFIGEITALLTKPNAYLDFSEQDLSLSPHELASTLRKWLEFVPEKILFATDAYPYSAEIGWEESGWIAARTGRRALATALTGMMRDGEVSRARASQLAKMVLRDNARSLYGMK